MVGVLQAGAVLGLGVPQDKAGATPSDSFRACLPSLLLGWEHTP